jgi:isoprenylcysteine carboxyl methyltransferase (ICMT) family protein YpbQ
MSMPSGVFFNCEDGCRVADLNVSRSSARQICLDGAVHYGTMICSLSILHVQTIDIWYFFLLNFHLSTN